MQTVQSPKHTSEDIISQIKYVKILKNCKLYAYNYMQQPFSRLPDRY